MNTFWILLLSVGNFVTGTDKTVERLEANVDSRPSWIVFSSSGSLATYLSENKLSSGTFKIYEADERQAKLTLEFSPVQKKAGK